jgi:hypothetical protein
MTSKPCDDSDNLFDYFLDRQIFLTNQRVYIANYCPRNITVNWKFNLNKNHSNIDISNGKKIQHKFE